MDDPRVIAALIAAATALITALITAIITFHFQRHKLDIDKERIDIAMKELQREHSLSYAAERVANALLSDEQWRLRTFDSLKRHLGGFEDDELRKVLVCSGAVRFFTKKTKTELWGLLERNMDRLGAIELDVEPETRPL